MDMDDNSRTGSPMEWTTSEQREVQLRRNTTDQQSTNRRSTRTEKKNKRKKKKTWLVLGNDNDVNAYYRFVYINFYISIS